MRCEVARRLDKWPSFDYLQEHKSAVDCKKKIKSESISFDYMLSARLLKLFKYKPYYPHLNEKTSPVYEGKIGNN